MQLIISQNNDSSIAVITPFQGILDLGITVGQIAVKDVPVGLPFWIVDSSVVPEDWEERNAWWPAYDKGGPDGFGGQSNEFGL